MPVMTGLSGNEMYCLHQKGLQAGDLVIGSSVFSVGIVGGIGSGLRTLAGGEVTQITSVIHDGRQQSYARMVAEAQKHGGVGITGVTSELIQHGGVIEFLAIGTAVKRMPGVTTVSRELPSQSIIDDKDTFINLAEAELGKMGQTGRTAAKKPEKVGWGAVLDVVLKLLGG